MSENKDYEALAIDVGMRGAIDRGALGLIEGQAADVERLFLHWIEADDRRPKSLAHETGIPIGRVKRILREGDFQNRYMEVTKRFRDAAAPYARGRAAELIDDVVERMEKIVTLGEDKDAIAASRVIVGMLTAGEDVRVEHDVKVDMRVLNLAAGIVEKGAVSVEDAQNMVRAQLQANVDEVEEYRSSKRS